MKNCLKLSKHYQNNMNVMSKTASILVAETDFHQARPIVDSKASKQYDYWVPSTFMDLEIQARSWSGLFRRPFKRLVHRFDNRWRWRRGHFSFSQRTLQLGYQKFLSFQIFLPQSWFLFFDHFGQSKPNICSIFFADL